MASIGAAANYGSTATYSGTRTSGDSVAEGEGDFSSYVDEVDEPVSDTEATFSAGGSLLVQRLLDVANIADGVAPVAVAVVADSVESSASDVENDGAEASGEEIYNPGDQSNDPRQHTYATIVVDGAPVAIVDNQGVAISSDEDYLKFADILADEVNGTNGPDLAQLRAEQIASALGGTVTIASTVLTQNEFDALASPQG